MTGRLLRGCLVTVTLGLLTVVLGPGTSVIQAGSHEPPLGLSLLRGHVGMDGTGPLAICVRWAFDPETLGGFPEEGFILERSDDGGRTFRLITDPVFTDSSGRFRLPTTKEEVIARARAARACPSTDPNERHRDAVVNEAQQLIDVVRAAERRRLMELLPGVSPPPGAPAGLEEADPTALLLLAAVDPLVAQVLGLLYVDRDVSPDREYQYRVTGLWGSAGAMSAGATSPAGPIDPLGAPGDVAAERQEGYVYSVDTKARYFGKGCGPTDDITSCPAADPRRERDHTPLPAPFPFAKVLWDRPPRMGTGTSPPKIFPVGYHIYRAEVADEREPPPTDETAYQPANVFLDHEGIPTEERFLVLDQEYLPSPRGVTGYGQFGDASGRPRDDSKLQFLDPHVTPGRTYYYKVTGVDVFGRESGRSAPAGPVTIPLTPPPAPLNLCVAAASSGDPSGLPPQRTRENECSPPPIQTEGTNEWSIKLRWDWPEVLQERFQVRSFEVECSTSRDFSRLIPCPFSPSLPVEDHFRTVERGTIRQYATDPGLLTLRPSEANVTFYYFRVVAINDAGPGAFSTVVTAVVSRQAPPEVSCPPPDSDRDPTPLVPRTPDELAMEVSPEPDAEGLLTVRLHWRAYPNADGYHLYRQVCPPDSGECGDFTPPFERRNVELIPQVRGAPMVYYTDRIEATAVRNWFRYRVKVVDGAGNISNFSCPSEFFKLPVTPKKPRIISVIGREDFIDVNGNDSFDSGVDLPYRVAIRWERNPEEVSPPEDPLAQLDCADCGYRVYRGDSEEAARTSPSLISGPDPLRIDDPLYLVDEDGTLVHFFGDNSTLEPRRSYCYVVEVINGYGRTARSDPRCARAPIPETPPSPPTDLRGRAIETGAHTGIFVVELNWTPPLPDPLHPDLRFSVWRRLNEFEAPRPLSTMLPSSPTPDRFTDTDVEPGSIYFYRVKVQDRFGNEAFSEEIRVLVPAITTLGSIRIMDLLPEEIGIDLLYRCVLPDCGLESRLLVRVLRELNERGEPLPEPVPVPFFSIEAPELIPSAPTDFGFNPATIGVVYGFRAFATLTVHSGDPSQDKSGLMSDPHPQGDTSPWVTQTQVAGPTQIPRRITTHSIELSIVNPQGVTLFTQIVPFVKTWVLPPPQFFFDLQFELKPGPRPLVVRTLPEDVAQRLRELGVPLTPRSTSFEPDESFVPPQGVILGLPDGLAFSTDTGKVSGQLSRRARPGEYHSRYFALDGQGERVALLVLRIRVIQENQPPIADPNGPYEAVVQPNVSNQLVATIQLDGRGSRDPDGQIVLYEWQFGDGTRGQGALVSHTYTLRPGERSREFTVCLTVTDDFRAQDSACTTATVREAKPGENLPPVADPNGPYQAQGAFNQQQVFGAAVKLDGSNSSDPDGTIVSFLWEFGDDQSQTTKEPTVEHFYVGDPTKDVTYDLCLTVTDDQGATDTKCTTVTILPQPNQPPSANPNGPYEAQGQFFEVFGGGTKFGAIVKLDGSNSFDPDGTIVSYFWEFGDGQDQTTTEPEVVHFYEGDPLKDVSYTLCLTVTDDQGATDTACTTVTVLGAPQ